MSFKWVGSYIDSPDWIKIKKATINPVNKKDNKCFNNSRTESWKNVRRFAKSNKN